MATALVHLSTQNPYNHHLRSGNGGGGGNGCGGDEGGGGGDDDVEDTSQNHGELAVAHQMRALAIHQQLGGFDTPDAAVAHFALGNMLHKVRTVYSY